MKLIKFVLLLAILTQLGVIAPCYSQLQLVKATEQRWAGGVAGHYGTNYYIELATTSHSPIPDTVWINGIAYPLDFKYKGGNAFRSIDSVKHEIKYVISVGESHNEFNKSLSHSSNDTIGKNPKLTHHFEGAAMISYIIKHKQHFFIVKSFEELPLLNYP